MLIGFGCCLATAWVYDHHPAAPSLDCFEATGKVRRCAQRTIGGVRIGTEEDDVIGSIQIGHWDSD